MLKRALHHFLSWMAAWVPLGLLKLASKALGLQVTGAGLALLAQALVARALGLSQFGSYALMMSIFTLFGGLSTLGLYNLVLRQGAIYASVPEPRQLSGVLAYSLLIIVTLSLAFGLPIVYILDRSPGGLDRWAAVSGILLIVTIALTRVASAAIRALGSLRTSLISDGIVRPALILAGFPLAYAVYPDMRSASGAIAVSALAGVGAAAVGLAWLYRYLRRYGFPRPDFSAAPSWTIAMLSFSTVMIAQITIMRTSVLALGHWHGPEEVGLFYSSMRLSEIVQYITLACNVAYSSAIARSSMVSDREGLERLSRSASRLSFTAGLAGCAVFYAGGDHILLLFGEEFVGAEGCLSILLAGTLTSSFFALTQPLLMLGGHERLAAGIFIVGAVFHVTANLVVVPSYGLIGAAGAMAGSNILLALMFAAAVRARINIRPGAI